MKRTEQTPEGTQALVPGVEPLNERQRLEQRQNRPLQGKAAPADHGLFDLNARAQGQLFE